jgi:hypothetical protein
MPSRAKKTLPEEHIQLSRTWRWRRLSGTRGMKNFYAEIRCEGILDFSYGSLTLLEIKLDGMAWTPKKFWNMAPITAQIF